MKFYKNKILLKKAKSIFGDDIIKDCLASFCNDDERKRYEKNLKLFKNVESIDLQTEIIGGVIRIIFQNGKIVDIVCSEWGNIGGM